MIDNKKVDIPIYGGYDRHPVKEESGGGDEPQVWNLGTAILYSLAHPQLFSIE